MACMVWGQGPQVRPRRRQMCNRCSMTSFVVEHIGLDMSSCHLSLAACQLSLPVPAEPFLPAVAMGCDAHAVQKDKTLAGGATYQILLEP